MAKPNPVVHFEMGYDDQSRMVRFYQTVFNWETQVMGPEMGNYVVVHTAKTDANGMIQEKGAINGGFYKKSSPNSQAPSVVVSASDINATVKDVEAAGGKILGGMTMKGEHTLEPQMIPGVGLWISAQDTEGNRFSILQPKS
jgi:hypothetical protein